MVRWFGIWEDNNTQNQEFIEHAEEVFDDEIGQIAVDILDTSRAITVVAPVAGIELEDIDVSLNNSTLVLTGKREQPEVYSDDVEIKNSECFWWRFTRNIILPDNLDFDSVKATMENGLLMVTINKLNFSSKQIEVESRDD